jgi:SPP1 gp7 family putative phage head morphogenesis protein
MRKIKKVPVSLKNINLERVMRRSGIYTQQKTNQQLKEKFKVEIKRQRSKKQPKTVEKIIKEQQRAASFSNEVVNAYWQKQIHLVDVIEQKFEKKLEQFINSFTRDFLGHLDQEVAAKKTAKGKLRVLDRNKDYFSDHQNDLIGAAVLDFTPLLDNLAVLSGQSAYELVGVKDPYIPYDYRKQIVENVTRFTGSMLDTDRQRLIDLITNGIEHGHSLAALRAEIEASFERYSKSQAKLITQTEVMRVSNQAALDAFEQSGVVEGKQWITFGATDECAAYEGQIETLKGSFYHSDSQFADGNPPLHPNCRCVLIPIVE